MPERKYLAIAGELRQAIQDGTYGPGDQVPGENELMARYEVARNTARQALDVLKNEGLIVAHGGNRGTTVREFKPVIRDGIGRLGPQTWPAGESIWSADVATRDLRVDQVEVGRQEAPGDVAVALGLAADKTVITRTRRFVLDGKPVLLSTSYIPASIAGGSRIEQEDTGPGGTYARLADLGHVPVRFREDLRSRMPVADEAERLDLPPGTPVVQIARTAYATDGSAVEVNEMTADAGSYIFRYDFPAPQ